jgi:hypothetical protein
MLMRTKNLDWRTFLRETDFHVLSNINAYYYSKALLQNNNSTTYIYREPKNTELKNWSTLNSGSSGRKKNKTTCSTPRQNSDQLKYIVCPTYTGFVQKVDRRQRKRKLKTHRCCRTNEPHTTISYTLSTFTIHSMCTFMQVAATSHSFIRAMTPVETAD